MRRTDPSLSAERHRDAKCRATDSGRPRRPEKKTVEILFSAADVPDEKARVFVPRPCLMLKNRSEPILKMTNSMSRFFGNVETA
jgi:hypothetical protein